MRYPKPFEDLIEGFRKLPGVGAKTAERYAYQMLEMKEEQIRGFLDAIETSYTQIKQCSVCGNLTIEDLCDICKDHSRDDSIICVVTKAKDVIAIEKMQEYHGMYHVLQGEVSTAKGILPDDIKIKELLARINDDTKEVIIATNPTMDGETTALYIAKLLESRPVVVSRLANGLPMGGHLDYADELTLIKAFAGRNRLGKST